MPPPQKLHKNLPPLRAAHAKQGSLAKQAMLQPAFTKNYCHYAQHTSSQGLPAKQAMLQPGTNFCTQTILVTTRIHTCTRNIEADPHRTFCRGRVHERPTPYGSFGSQGRLRRKGLCAMPCPCHAPQGTLRNAMSSSHYWERCSCSHNVRLHSLPLIIDY